jgi:Asp-tRNAAsn/Glu-tRNAGln amidotransferase B subunit (PET112 homolog)
MQWLEISNCDMEKGELRVDVNLSLRPVGQEKFGTRIEIKNLNSFKAVKDALNYEIGRQAEVLSNGGKITQETRLWSDGEGKTEVMRSKETAQEYRYFPEPDLPPLYISDELIAEVKASMPVMPAKRKETFEKEYGLSSYDAALMILSRKISDYFEETVKSGASAKAAVNWIGTDIMGKLNAEHKEIDQSPIKAKELAALIKYVEGGKISTKMARGIFAKAWESGKSVKELVESSGASQISDEGQLEEWAKEAVAANPKAVADYKGGNTKAVGALVGFVMKKSKGKANPAVLNKIFEKLLA